MVLVYLVRETDEEAKKRNKAKRPTKQRSGDESLSPETVIDKRRWRDKERWRENKSSVMWERWWGGGQNLCEQE